jgi:Flp pilus assembly pilin Flp
MFGLICKTRKSRAGGIFRFRKLRAFGKREDGVAAVEFALVAAPFFALLFAIIETALVFLASQTMETAVAGSGRLVLTGEVQTAGLTAGAFKDKVCGKIFGLFDCEKGMTVDVKNYKTFGDADLKRPVDDDGNVKPGAFEPGKACDIVVVRLIYKFPVFVSLLGNLADIDGDKRLLVATSVFRNEPYQGTPCG